MTVISSKKYRLTIDPKHAHTKSLDAPSYALLKADYLLPFINDESHVPALPRRSREMLKKCIEEFDDLSIGPGAIDRYKKTRSSELLTDMHRLFKSLDVSAELYKGFGDVIEELGINPKDEGFLVAVEYAKRISEENNEPMLMCPDSIIEQSLNTPQEKK